MRVTISRSPALLLLMAVLGAGLVGIWRFEGAQVERSRAFLPATAVISSVHYAPEGDGEFYYEGTIEASGMPFRSSRISYGNVSSKKSYRQFVETHEKGDVVNVYVAPDGASEVIVHRGELSPLFGVILAVGIGLTLAALLGLVRALFQTS